MEVTVQLLENALEEAISDKGGKGKFLIDGSFFPPRYITCAYVNYPYNITILSTMTNNPFPPFHIPPFPPKKLFQN